MWFQRGHFILSMLDVLATALEYFFTIPILCLGLPLSLKSHVICALIFFIWHLCYIFENENYYYDVIENPLFPVFKKQNLL